MKVFQFLLLVPFALSLSFCTKIPEQKSDGTTALVEQDPLLKKHSVFNSEAELLLDKRYERFNMAELIAVTKAQPETSFLNQIFNESQLQLAELLGPSFYVFIDTSTYTDIIHFERLDKLMPINKGAASYIGGLFRKKVQLSDPNGFVSIISAKFGQQPSYTYGYYRMKSTSPQLTTFSNHYAISSNKASYILYNISLEDTDYSNLKNQLKFR